MVSLFSITSNERVLSCKTQDCISLAVKTVSFTAVIAFPVLIKFVGKRRNTYVLHFFLHFLSEVSILMVINCTFRVAIYNTFFYVIVLGAAKVTLRHFLSESQYEIYRLEEIPCH